MAGLPVDVVHHEREDQQPDRAHRRGRALSPATRSRTGRGGSEQQQDDRGAGLVGTTAGVTVFLIFLLLAVQILVGLFGRSVVTSTAHDGARSVAGARVDHADPDAVATAQAAAVDRMRRQLGQVGTTASFDWSGSTADTVVLRVQVDTPRFALPGFDGPLWTDHIDRTVTARVERLQ